MSKGPQNQRVTRMLDLQSTTTQRREKVEECVWGGGGGGVRVWGKGWRVIAREERVSGERGCLGT